MNPHNQTVTLRSSLASKLLACFVVAAVALCALPSRQAEACGSYGPPSDDQLIRYAITDAFFETMAPEEFSNSWVELENVAITAGTVAVVTAYHHKGGIRAKKSETYLLFNTGGAWTVADTPNVKLLVNTLKHALDTNVQATLNKSHNAVKLPRLDAQGAAHTFARLAK